ncbi:phosphate/phosphite/phosphonate ABC transporter substrate-binding protein [Paenibacillus alkalitolerans]|uniref:phosphate/phosphite/phosphonate ABC transporter substrate-binding protein n=1 Tax=Paenibacillus alkalitolerans TaxID=2799335 RepID=UPI0018F389CE|nr:phosphate/phosphite/phosphonate ABC transporter substrate-binding protein [Paenibacillus alkalitolerans]
MRNIVIIASILILSVIFAGCTQDKLADGSVTGVQPNPDKLRVALLPDESPSTVIRNNKPLQDYLAKTLNKEVEIVVTTDYSTMIEAMRKGQIEFAYFGPLSYVLLKTKMEQAEPFAAKLDKGSPTYNAVVIANAEAGIEKLSDIKGKTVAFGDTASTSSHMIPKEMLKNAGLEPDADYEEQFVGAHDAVAKAVQNGNAHAGGLSKPIFESLVEKGAIDKNKVKVIDVSKPYPNYPWVLNSELDPELKEAIKNAIYGAKDPEVLSPLKTEGFVPIADKDFDVIREMVKMIGIDLEKVQ